jgi:hypothetical protein
VSHDAKADAFEKHFSLGLKRLQLRLARRHILAMADLVATCVSKVSFDVLHECAKCSLIAAPIATGQH